MINLTKNCLALTLLLVCTSALAVPMVFEFETQVTSATSSGFSVGDIFSGSFTYDNALSGESSHAGSMSYNFNSTVTVDGATAASFAFARLYNDNDHYSGDLVDMSLNSFDVGYWVNARAGFILYQPCSNYSCGSSPLLGSQFLAELDTLALSTVQNEIRFYGGEGETMFTQIRSITNASLTSVPEPGSLYLFALGIIGAGFGFAKRRWLTS